MTDGVDIHGDKTIPSIQGLRGFFGSFEFAQAEKTQTQLFETEKLSIEATEEYIAQNTNDFIKSNLRDQAQCIKIIQGSKIILSPKLQTNRGKVKAKSVPFVSDLYSAKTTIDREELITYLNSYVRGKQYLKDEQKLLLLVMILELGECTLLERYCKDKNILGLLLIYPDFINALPARENIFKRWFNQIDAIHDEQYPFDRTSNWGKYLHENFGEIQVVKYRLSDFSEETEDVVGQTKSEVNGSLDTEKIGIEVFKKYIPVQGQGVIEGIYKDINRLYVLGENGINSMYSRDTGSVILDIDKLCLLLIGNEPSCTTEQNWKEHTTLYRLFMSKDMISKQELDNVLVEYRDSRKGKNSHFSENIFQSIILSILEANIQQAYGNVGVENAVLILPLLAVKFINSYDGANQFFTWWFNQIRGELKNDIEKPESDIWKYLLQNFGEIDIVKEKYKIISYRGLEEGVDIPDEKDLEMLFDILGIPPEKNARKNYDSFLRRTGETYSINGNGRSEIEAFIAMGSIRGNNAKPSGSTMEVNQAIEEKNFIKIYHILGLPSIPANSRKKSRNFY